MELLTDARIGARDIGAKGCTSGRQRWQRYAAPGRERAHQHLPALTDLIDATNDIIDRDENIVAPVRTVLEDMHRRQMTAADADAGQMRGHQRQRDADVVAIANEMIGI